MDSVTYYNKEGSALKVEPEGWVVPQPCHTWHQTLVDKWLEGGNTIKAFSLPLDRVVSEKKQELKVARDLAAQGTLEVVTSLGNTYTVDLHERNRSTMHQAYDNAVVAGAPLTDTITWKMGDNTYHPISYQEMAEVGLQMGVYIGQQFAKEAIKLSEIEACGNDAVCISNITW